MPHTYKNSGENEKVLRKEICLLHTKETLLAQVAPETQVLQGQYLKEVPLHIYSTFI